MSQIEIIARSQKQAFEKAAKQLNVTPEELTVLEEYDPDDLDLKNLEAYEKENPEDQIDGEPVLYVISINMDKAIIQIREWLEGLMSRFQKGITVEMIYEDGIATGVLRAEDPSILIGRQGQTLEALQHIVTRILPRIVPNCPIIQLDVGDYREKRLEKLEDIADRAVEKARKFKRNVDLRPMSSQDRKYVHNYLKDEPGIKTNSYGADPNRYLRIEVPGGDKGEKPRRAEGGARREDRGRDRDRGGDRDRGNRDGNRVDSREGSREGSRDGNRVGSRDGNRERGGNVSGGNVRNTKEKNGNVAPKAPARRKDVDGNRADGPGPKQEYFYRSEPQEQPKKLTIEEMLGKLPAGPKDDDYEGDEFYDEDLENEEYDSYEEEEEEEQKPKPKKSRKMIDEIE